MSPLSDTRTNRTRRRLLDAGFRMWVEEPPQVLFGGFTVSRVAKAAGVTRATFYSYWPSTDQYLEDLLDHLADHRPETSSRQVATHASQIGSAGDDVVSQLLAICAREIDVVGADPALRVRLAFLSQMDDPDVATALRRQLRRLEAMRSDRYEAVIAGWGREPRPPFDTARLFAVFQMLRDAMVARHVIDPEGMPRETYGLVVAAMLMLLTRRIDDPRDLAGVVDQANTWPAMGIRLRSQVRPERLTTTPVMEPPEARAVVVAARRLLATVGWQELALNDLAAVVGRSEDVLLRAFGSRSGLAMSVFNLNLEDQFAATTYTGDPITDLRTTMATIGRELRRLPSLTQSVVLLLAGVAALPLPEILADQSPRPLIIDQVTAARDAGQLRADIDPPGFTNSLIRVLLAESAWPAGSDALDVTDLMLAGAGAGPPTSPAT